MRAWPSKRLDFSRADWVFALRACSTRGTEDGAAGVERLWSPNGDGIAGLSVRTLFDLYLAATGWGKGDRIVFTALTVADMPRIAREHGLEVVSVDIDRATTEPDPAALAAALTPGTRALVFTHLYGARVDVGPALALARARGVRFVEDCAEAYAGPGWRGHPDSDLSLFSFGPIKTATAFGGGLARVADPALLVRMRALAAAYPVQPRAEYLARVVKYGWLGVAGLPTVFGPLVTVLDAIGPGHDELLHRLTRGFAGPDFFRRIRRRPCEPLLSVLERRLRQGDAPWLRRVEPGERLVGRLFGVRIPAARARPHSYWLVPVEADDPAALIEALARDGFHATRGRAFDVVESDRGVWTPRPIGARSLHERLVFLPFSPEMPREAIDLLAEAVNGELQRQVVAMPLRRSG